jgi:sugar lactone lactonase YvrE
VRRLLTVSAVAVILLVAFALARMTSAPAIAAQIEMSAQSAAAGAPTRVMFAQMGMASPGVTRGSTQSSMQGATPSSPAGPMTGAMNGGATAPMNSSSAASSTSPAGANGAPIVVATGISARALALHASTPHDAVYYTDPSAPNRVMALSQGAANPKLSFSAIAGTGAAGFLGDGGAALAAQFNLKLDSLFERSGIAVAADGTMFVADTLNATIRSIAGPESSEPGVIRSVAGKWAPPQNVKLVEPMGIALDRAGNLYIADHGANAIIELHADTGLLEKIADVESPASIAVTADGKTIFVASPETGAVISPRLDSSRNPRLLSIGGQGSGVKLAVRDGACRAAAQDMCPSGLAVDGSGNLFYADANTGEIRRIDATLPMSGFAIFASGLHSPGDMAFDDKGNLYVSEQATQRILEFIGAGVAANSVTLSPISATFGDQPTGSTTAPQSFTLTNNSGGALTGVAISFVGGNTTDFVNASTSCLASLANATSCTINVAFAPMAEGARSSTLTVTSSSTTTPTAAVSGTGDTYSLALASDQLQSVTVTAGQTATWNLQVTNDATFTGTVTFVCPPELPTLTSCSFTPTTVNFTAPNQTIPFMASLMTTSQTPTKSPVTSALPPMNRPQTPGGWLRFPARGIGIATIFAFAAMVLLGLCSGVPLGRQPLHFAFSRRGQNRIQRQDGARKGRRYKTTGAALPQRRWAPTFALLVAIAAAAFVGGCHHHLAVVTGTPAGTTDLILQATAQGASRAIGITIVVK